MRTQGAFKGDDEARLKHDILSKSMVQTLHVNNQVEFLEERDMRYFLIASVLVSVGLKPLLAEEPYKAGDRIVVIEECDIVENGKVVGHANRGFPFDVQQVEQDRLRIQGAGIGWIPASKVVPIDQAIGYFSELIAKDGNDREDLYARAMVWLSTKNYDKAIEDFTRCIEIAPMPSDHNERGFCWMMKGDQEKAFADFNTAVKLDPKNASLILNRGLSYERAGDLQRAMEDFDAALAIDPQLIGAYQHRGKLRMQHGELQNAIADFDEVLKLNPNDLNYVEHRGRCWLALGEAGKAVADFTTIIERYPNAASPLFYRGDAYMAQGSFDKALADYQQVLQLLPENMSVLHRIGRAYRATGEIDKANENFTAALKVEPTNVYVLRDRADLFREAERDEAAIADYSALLKQIPNDIEALINRAICLKSLNKSEAALTDLTAAITINPTHGLAPLAYYIRGDLYSKQGEYAKAIADYDVALKANPSAELMYTRAKCFRSWGKIHEAIAGLRESLKADPNSIRTLNDLAWIYATWPADNVRDGDEAVKLATQAAELTEWKHPLVLDTLSASFAEQGDFEEAVKTLKQGMDLMSPEVIKETEAEEKLKLYQSHQPYREAITTAPAK